MISQIQQQILQNMNNLEIIIENYKKDINKYIEKIEKLEKKIYDDNNIILKLNQEIKKRDKNDSYMTNFLNNNGFNNHDQLLDFITKNKNNSVIDLSNIYDYNILIKNPLFKSLSDVNSGLVKEIKKIKIDKYENIVDDIDDIIVDYNLSIYDSNNIIKEDINIYTNYVIYDANNYINNNIVNNTYFSKKITLNQAYYDRYFKEIIKNKKIKSIIFKKNIPKKIINPKKVTLNNCFYNKYKNEQDIIKRKNILSNFKRIIKKVKIINIFIKELNNKKNYNIQIKKIFNKIKNNINNKISIKIKNPKNEIENLLNTNIISKYNVIDSQSKIGNLFIEKNIKNKNDIKKYIKTNDNPYLNSLIKNEERITRFISFCKRIYLLNKYLSIDTIIYCKFLNDIRDISDDMFLDIINLVLKKNIT